MSAAIAAKQADQKLRVCIVEKNPLLGKKIYATGNGKCNLGHESCLESIEVLKFFDQIGIFTRTDIAGRMYPASEQASDVVDALKDALAALDVEVLLGLSPQEIEFDKDHYTVIFADRRILSRKVLVATGGKAGPQYGCLGEGYAFAKSFGHHVKRVYPVLSPLECEGDYTLLKGIRNKGVAALLHQGDIIAKESGEIQFTEEGLSGICIFNLSRFINLNKELPMKDAFKEYEVEIDFVPTMNETDLQDYLELKAQSMERPSGHLLLTMVHAAIAVDILKRANLEKDADTSKLNEENLLTIAHLLKHWKTSVTGVKGWKKAQCTAGGVPMAEIDERTGESLLSKGLYFAGEVLDYDGPSGGFNLNFAWISGLRAGKAMADEII
jgi:hypothetical protein